MSKPAKFLLIGSALLLLLLALLLVRPPNTGGAWANAAPASRDDWTCEWLDAPTISQTAGHHQCHGAVQCRHRTMQTFVPQIRQVTCPTQGNARDAAACFTASIGTL